MVASILLAANDSSLKLGMMFGLVFMAVGAGFAANHLIQLGRSDREEKYKHLLSLVVAIGFVGVGWHITWLEHDILTNYQYVEGRLLQKQRCGAKNPNGVQFGYTFNDKRYTSCTTVSKDHRLQIPGGRYWVRVSPEHPDIGRIDLSKPVE